ncbi:MAG: hypothetical protein GEU79_18345 [Acidimicrobiia bacterium]|nr:hypothetical protein [Acidimicrobiia bacterium]
MSADRHRLSRGSYVSLDEDQYLVVQHDALDRLPTVVALPATPQPVAHRPPLVVVDSDNDLWIHTYAPATLWRDDLTFSGETISAEIMVAVDAGIASVVDVAVIA